ncbi:MAG: DNA polymerase III subunit delta [Gammaproteobacteria bacterium]|nr:DNA polymerase III subunit delta [Gammaproteobacteria bacterium]
MTSEKKHSPDQKNRLHPVYLIAGDDPLLVQEAVDSVRQQAAGAIRRTFFSTDDFDWQELTTSGDNMSLFGDQQLVEMHIPGGKPGAIGSRVLRDIAAKPPEHDILMVIVSGARYGDLKKASWAKALGAAGQRIEAWRPKPEEMPRWVSERMQKAGLQPDAAAARLLAERVEGNLVAASQEIQKLLLLRGPGPVDEKAVSEAVTDSARFDVFQLTGAALAGSASRALRVLYGLRDEHLAPAIVSWALARDVIDLCQIAGATPESQPKKLWPARTRQLEPAVRRLGVNRCRQLLMATARADAMTKGQLRGDPWAQFAAIVSALAGKRTRAVA